MKKILLGTLLAATATHFASAQTVINDSVKIGTGYPNQIWYSLQNDEQGTAPKNNWDLAFNLKDINSAIQVNTVAGTTLWAYPKDDTSGWSTVDTMGLSGWSKRYNSDTSWAFGAIGNYANPSNPYDLDWGIYDMTTHQVTGDSLYIVKLSGGQYKKLWIQSLISGTFTFRYADLDGSNELVKTIKKTDYPGKNFAYYSIQSNAALDREPAAAGWDLVFTQYTDMSLVYTVTGILHNRGVRVAQAGNLPDKNNYTNWSAHTLNSAINEIGYDWKTYAGAYVIKDSTAYFVRTAAGDIWKMIFTGFASTDGKFLFSKQKLVTTAVGTVPRKTDASLSLYPNPATGGYATVLYDFDGAQRTARLSVTDMAGRVVHSADLQQTAGLHQYQLSLNGLQAGIYLVNIETDHGRMTQKLCIR